MSGKVFKTLKERFYEKVSLDWQWKAAKLPFGYGHMYINGKVEAAHRISYRIHNGEIPEGMLVLHNCDEPGCVNPEHLYLGTDADNMLDKVKRGRCINGEEIKQSKLTKNQVIEIKKKREKGLKLIDIANEYGVSTSQIRRISLGINWTRVNNNYLGGEA